MVPELWTVDSGQDIVFSILSSALMWHMRKLC